MPEQKFITRARGMKNMSFLVFMFVGVVLPSLPSLATPGWEYRWMQSQIEITGTVTDQQGNPIAGASVTIDGSNVGTTSNESGNFKLTVPENGKIIVSSVGYQSQTTQITSGTTVLNIKLFSTDNILDQVVVVGYGTQRKIDVTGAVGEIKGDDIAATPVPNISSSLAGNVPGVSMGQGGAQPGTSPSINIRGIGTIGNSNPLIIIDGIPRNNMNEIDPSTIESISILKDAAAVAPYGLGGANGVVLITTKKGVIGKPTLSINGYQGWQTATYLPKMLNGIDYMKLSNEAYLNENPGGQNLIFDPALIDDYKNLNSQDPDKYPLSNASKTIIQNGRPQSNYDVQLRGGGENVRYFSSFGVYSQKGIFDNVKYNRYNFNLSVDIDATPTTQISAKVIGAFDKINNPDVNINVGKIMRSSFKYIPVNAFIYSNGLWGQSGGNPPMSFLNNGGYAYNKNNTFLTTISIDQQLPFIKGLAIKGVFSFDPIDSLIRGWHQPFIYYSQDLSTTPPTYTRQISSAEGQAPDYRYLTQTFSKRNSYTYQGMLTFDRKYGDHAVSLLGVVEARNGSYRTMTAQRNRFAVDIDELDMGSSNSTDIFNGGTLETSGQIGLVYRLHYSYKNKYQLETSGRYDGHYFFAPGSRFGFFPSVSAGWVISQESFMKNVNFLSYLKLRGSWGKSGNLAGTGFQFLPGYILAGDAYAYGINGLVQGSSQQVESNPFITWEIAKKLDFGVDFSLFKNLVDVTFDYFHDKRTGMLLPPAVTVPLEYGIDLADENGGIMDNNGFEISANLRPRDIGNGIKIGVGGNLSFSKNKMINIFETSTTFNDPRRSRTGKPYLIPFGYKSLGYFTTADDTNHDGIINAADGYNVEQFGELHPGDIKYADISGPNGVPDGKIDAFDEVVSGHPTYPGVTYGFTATAEWKGFDVSLFFQGAGRYSIDLRGFRTIPFFNNSSNSTYEYFNNRWTPETPNAKYPRANQAPYANNNQASDFWMKDIRYLRLKTVNIGYTIPNNITKKAAISNARIYVSGQNLITFSNLKFVDPAVDIITDSDSINDESYPYQKVYVVGLSITF